MENLYDDYIQLTKYILSGIKNGISVDEFFDKREKIISNIIEDNSFSKEEKKIAYEKSGAKQLDKQVVEVIKSEIVKTKQDIKNVHDSRKMYSSYVSNNMSGNFLKRRI